MMRKIFACVGISMLTLVACKSSDESEGAGASTTDAPETSVETDGSSPDTTEFVSTDNRAPGVTDTSIKIGVEYMVFPEALKERLRTWHGDYRAMYEAAIDQVNAEGGIHGRILEPVFVEIQLSVDGADDAACTALTEDTQVFVAIGYFSNGDQAMCFLDTHETAVIGAQQTDELRAQAKAPWFTAETQGGDSEGDAIRSLVSADVLAGKVGVVGTSTDLEYYNATSKALLEDAGVSVVNEAFPELTGSDAAADQAALSTAIEGSRAAGAEVLLFVGTRAAAPALDELVKTDWRPALRFASRGSVGIFDGDSSRDRSVLEGAYSAGAFDHADTYLEMTDEPTKSCVSALQSRGIELVEKSGWTFESGIGKTWTAAQAACTQVQLLRAILDAAGPNLDYGTFQHAGENLGELYLFGDPNPRFYGPGASVDGDPTLSIYEWKPEMSQWAIVD